MTNLTNTTTFDLRRRIAVACLLSVAAVAPLACADAEAEQPSSGPDPLLEDQWALDALGLPTAWEATTGCGTTIAVVDSGVDLDHPDLRDSIVAGIDLVDGDYYPDDEDGHGTHVAGIAAAGADNGIGIAGAAPCASIMPVRVLDAEGSGSDETIAAGIRWAADHDADVINLSLGETGLVGRLRAGGELNDAILDAHAAGAVVVAAAGNDGAPHLRNYRVQVPVIVVGATEEDGHAAEFSNYGDLRMVAAPGEGILSTAPTADTTIWPDGTDGYEPLDGTSMASPYVAGVAALLVSQGLDADEVADVLRDTAQDPGDDVRLGSGRIDAAAAVAAAAELAAVR